MIKELLSPFLKHMLFTTMVSCVFVTSITAQITIVGQVKGITSTKAKNSPVLLNEAIVSYEVDGRSKLVKSNLLGLYKLSLKRDKRYLITVSRENYNFKSIYVNTHNLPIIPSGSAIELKNLDFHLLKTSEFPGDISLKEDMGQLAYDDYQKTFVLSANADFSDQKMEGDNSLVLLDKTITILEEDQITLTSEAFDLPKETSTTVIDRDTVPSDETAVIAEEIVEQLITSIDLSEMDSEEEIFKQRLALDSAKKNLESLKQQVKSKEDSLYVGKLEAQLLALEMALDSAERTIESQKSLIAYQKRRITIYIISAILLLVIVLVGIWFYREKVRMNHLLEEKNQLILDGITYANTIQNSFLKSTEEIRTIIPNFTMFFKPRDIVSGDIYWVGQVNSNVIVAAIDCTGHGVPGAFISMIANTLLNEIVNNKKQLDPGSILNELHLGVMEVLQQDAEGSQSQDGMDMSLAVINASSKTMKFAGARNHMLKVAGDEIELIRADINSIGGRALRSTDGFSKRFSTKQIKLNKEATYYLFSDGFIDQFGGPENCKFNLPNFYQLLKECALLTMQDQEKKLSSTFYNWKGKADQIDDVLVLGFKV